MLNPNIANIWILINRSDCGSLIAGSSRFPTFPIFSFHPSMFIHHPVYLPKNHHEYSEKIDLRFCMHHTYISLFWFLNFILHTHMISSTVPGAFLLGICLPIYLKCNFIRFIVYLLMLNKIKIKQPESECESLII